MRGKRLCRDASSKGHLSRPDDRRPERFFRALSLQTGEFLVFWAVGCSGGKVAGGLGKGINRVLGGGDD